MSSLVGTSPPRIDGVAKVTGAARYVDDLSPPNLLYGRTVRSTVPHAVLEAIELDPAFDWEGITVVTADDIPAEGQNVVALILDDQPALVPLGGTIRHVDEAVALVAATSALLALSAHAEVETAASWAEALPLVLKSRPGLILVDLDIPGFPGTDVVRFLKRSLSQKVKVALLSSADLATLEQARHDSGADAALQKSFDAAMVRAVRALLPKARPVIG